MYIKSEKEMEECRKHSLCIIMFIDGGSEKEKYSKKLNMMIEIGEEKLSENMWMGYLDGRCHSYLMSRFDL